jgi:8-oxo-dGTP diphosphatase
MSCQTDSFMNEKGWYPAFHLTMHCFLCTVVSGRLELKEHESAVWLAPQELSTVNWLPADKAVVEKLSLE